jgi:S-DNA-T family DNA segregation ATPase FtsK/SpoIIIE
MDIVGIAMALIGLLTLLSLISVKRSGLTGAWVDGLTRLFGWGVYVLPLGLIVVGLWLVLREIERLPRLSLERLVGMALLFVNLLAWFHLAAGSDLSSERVQVGGGYTGGIFEQGLVNALGTAGTVIVLLAWFLIALAFTLDLSILDFFRWLIPLEKRVRGALQSWLERKNYQAGEPALFVDSDGFTQVGSRTAGGGEMEEELGAAENAAANSGISPVKAGAAVVPTAFAVPQIPAIPWTLPPVDAILEKGAPTVADEQLEQRRGLLIEETLQSFGAPAHIVEIHRGPTITQFGVEPDFVETRAGRTRVRVSKIVSLADDLALALAAPRIRIQAPVPGRNYVGIEVPNIETSRVVLRDVMESEGFLKLRSPLRLALGKDVSGRPISADMTSMPHLLIAGATGAGKSVCVNSILSALLINNTPDTLRLILVDPKRVELTGYNGIPHLLSPVVVEAEQVVGALQWMMREMDNRYRKFAQIGARNIVDYNAKLQARGEKKIPYLVVVIDELADLMMLAPAETERSITRLAQLARATGLHLIIATQRPSVDVLTGLIKANFPARIAFSVASGVDSRVILDQPGAERLLGRGDMLFQAPDAPAPVRLQGVFVSDEEIQRLVRHWKDASIGVQVEALASGPVESLPDGVPLKQAPLWEDMAPKEDGDPLYKEAVDLVRREGRASISMLQRKMRIGYTRAARLVDTMEQNKIIGPSQANTQVREVLDYGAAAPPVEE